MDYDNKRKEYYNEQKRLLLELEILINDMEIRNNIDKSDEIIFPQCSKYEKENGLNKNIKEKILTMLVKKYFSYYDAISGDSDIYDMKGTEMYETLESISSLLFKIKKKIVSCHSLLLFYKKMISNKLDEREALLIVKILDRILSIDIISMYVDENSLVSILDNIELIRKYTLKFLEDGIIIEEYYFDLPRIINLSMTLYYFLLEQKFILDELNKSVTKIKDDGILRGYVEKMDINRIHGVIHNRSICMRVLEDALIEKFVEPTKEYYKNDNK